MKTHAIAPVLALAALVGLGSAGCSKQLKNTVIPNQLPSLRLTYAPIDTTSEFFYIYRMNWVGYDPDGRVARFEYVVDPPTAVDAVIPWVSTTRNEQTIIFTATKPESLPTPGHPRTPRGQGFHVFAIRAVDNLGAVSEPVKRAFFSFGVAPTVQIEEPSPSKLLSPSVTPAVRVRWTGRDFIDPNGFVFEKPVQYKYKLYKKGPQIPWNAWLQDPDSLRRQVAPTFAGWDSTGPDSAEVQYTNLTPNSEYLFVVVAIGRSGAYSPIFDLNSNMLRMFVGFAGVLGPRITLFNSFFQFTYPSGGFPSPLDPSWAVQLQVPSGQPLTFNWIAEAPPGSIMRRYRWVLDLLSLDDETPRSSQNDWYHWSPWSQTLSATVGPFAGAGGDTGEVHNFYVEAEDINGLVSLGWVQFRVYRPTFDQDLLIVKDTRFIVDQNLQGRTDTLRTPSGTWPTRAELDTFLFAVGGVRWKMTPPGQLSPPGIFKGYRYDTLGTRYGQENPTVPLGLLGQYRHVVWMTDLRGSLLESNPNSMALPMTTLLYMSRPNRQNTLATWVSQGGKLWALGSGFGNATNAPWNNLNNDVNQVRTYRFDGTRPDLTPGRFMFDLAHWRSEFRVFGPVFVRFARYDQPDPTVGLPRPATYWKGGKFTNPEVDYTVLPTTLQPRDPATDPIWPFRSLGDFYIGNQTYSSNGINLEFLSLEHYMLEQVPVPSPTNPDSSVERSTLDSLYLAYGSSYPGQMNQSSAGQGVNTVMTYYHGRENAPLVFSGTSLWDFRRQDCVALVDFVLGRLWGLSKSTLYAPRAVAPSLARPAGSPPRPRSPSTDGSPRKPQPIAPGRGTATGRR
jgi:hypothetical protein